MLSYICLNSLCLAVWTRPLCVDKVHCFVITMRPAIQVWRSNLHEDVIKWKRLPCYWPFMRGIYRWPVNFPSQRAVTQSFDGFFDLRLNKRLSKPSRRRWFETSSRSLWRHCNVWANFTKIYNCHDVSGGIGGCRYDKLPCKGNIMCNLRRQSWHHDDSMCIKLAAWQLSVFSVSHINICNYRVKCFRQSMYNPTPNPIFIGVGGVEILVIVMVSINVCKLIQSQTYASVYAYL